MPQGVRVSFDSEIRHTGGVKGMKASNETTATLYNGNRGSLGDFCHDGRNWALGAP